MMYFKQEKSIVSKTMGWEIWVVKSMESNGTIKANTFKTKKEAFSFYKRGKYAENKEFASQKAIDWQNETAKKDVFYEKQEQQAIIELLKKQVDDANKTLMRCLIVKKTPIQDVVEPYLIRWGIIKK